MADRAEQANKYMEDKMFFTPRMFKVTNTLAPEVGERFADFYESVWADGNLSRKIKELMFVSIGVAYMSPRCIIHVQPAIKAGATDGEIFEAVSVGMLAAGFVAQALGTKVPPLGESVTARVSTGVLFRVLGVAGLDYKKEESYVLLDRLLEEAERQRG